MTCQYTSYCYTYIEGSNILDNMKHCVAMGGVGDCTDGGACDGIWALSALAAASGIWKPVPENNQKSNSIIIISLRFMQWHIINIMSF